jgi:metal-dependent amidase/aminoacylase/carboxypeptidase family protein
MPRPPVASLSLLAALLAAAPLCAQSSSFALASAALGVREADLIAFRRELHRRPELSGDEGRTAAAIAMHLRSAGFEVRTDVGGHGIVAVLRGARPGPLVAFRADMDAVRSDAPDPVPFRSEYPGIRHICGHDVHATIGLAVADAFGAARARLAGSVMLVFQPAEESANGARAMLADGAFARERPVAIYAVHTAPLEVGTLGTMAGGLMPGRDRLRVTLSGRGDVAAAALAAERLIERANTVADAFVAGPPDLVYVSHVTRRRIADDAWAVVAGLSIADAGVRTRVRETLERELRALHGAGIAVDVRYDARTIAGVTNDPALVVRGNAAIAAALGPAAVRPITRVVPVFSEDFGSFQEQVPGVMYFLGVSNTAAGTRGMPHAPDYVADEGAILVGARAMVAVMLERMGEG